MADAIPAAMVEGMAKVFRLFADASRLAILSCIMQGRGEKNVGEIAQATGRSTANVSKHLKMLADGGILARRKDGVEVFYHLDDPVWEQVCRQVSRSILKGLDA
jgi:ArsR family transcriptional regulator